MQPAQAAPVGRRAVSAGAVGRLDRGLELEAPDPAETVRADQVSLAALDQIDVPESTLLLAQRDELAVCADAGRGAGHG